MMHDEEAASSLWKLNPKKFGADIKSIKFLGSGVKTRVGRISGNNNFLGLILVLVLCRRRCRSTRTCYSTTTQHHVSQSQWRRQGCTGCRCTPQDE